MSVVHKLSLVSAASMGLRPRSTPLKKALSDKGNAYGELDRPFVIAVRTSRMTTDEFDILGALYGSPQVQFTRGLDGQTATREVRAPDGYWFGGTHTGVTAMSRPF